MKPLFSLGKILSTPGAIDAMQKEGIGAGDLLARHVTGDWGDLDEEDKRRNDEAAKPGGARIFSAYVLPKTQVKLWLITEWDRSATTFLLPSEY